MNTRKDVNVALKVVKVDTSDVVVEDDERDCGAWTKCSRKWAPGCERLFPHTLHLDSVQAP